MSKGFTHDGMKKARLNGSVYYFSVDCTAVDKSGSNEQTQVYQNNIKFV